MKPKGPGAPGSDRYTVGKARPPLSTRWKRGHSGNPKGRPKGAKNMVTIFNDTLNKKIDITENGRLRKVTVREAIVLKITNQALKGDPRAISTILAKEPEIAAAGESASIPTITKDMTPKQAAEIYQRFLRD
jgi:hypothetical protein